MFVIITKMFFLQSTRERRAAKAVKDTAVEKAAKVERVAKEKMTNPRT